LDVGYKGIIMMKRIERLLRWLYPGIGVKRWAGLAVIGALIAATGILAWIGRDIVSSVYYYLSPTESHTFWVAAAMMVFGVGALLLGINRLMHAIVGGVSPESQGRASEVLYSRRRLRRGPRIVAVGGGTGLSSLLRGLKEWTGNTTAVVTVMDDGGSSGRLREEMNMLPPGDIRNCIIALAEDESQIASLFQHRFKNGSGSLDGHSLGNLILAGLQQNTGRFDTAVEELSHILKIRGEVVPTTLEDVKLVAKMEDGDIITGEVAIAEDPRRVERMSLSNEHVQPYRKVVQALEHADLIVLGPGSLYTSIVPNLLVEGVPQAIERSDGVKIYVANLVTQPGETDDFSLADHVRVLGQYIDLSSLDYIIANHQPFPKDLEAQYLSEGAIPVAVDAIGDLTKAKLITQDLYQVVETEAKCTIKHNAAKLAQIIIQCAK
jgi:uncharacterized cofD-like protein